MKCVSCLISFDGRVKLKTRVKEFRTIMGMTQEELAKLANVSSRTIISIEKGQYKPSIMLAYKISLIFDTTIEDLCCFKENLQSEEK